MSPPVVVVEAAEKRFRRPHEALFTLKERALHPFRRTGHDTFEALRGVSFHVRRGEFFGVVGRNGSGKSTLLKCLAGIYRLNAGTISIDGRLSTFIELGVGFNPNLAARDNVVLNGIMLGLSPKEARRRYDEVIDFAELQDFQDLKLKNYSSGMQVRLAFSVAIQVDADILLVDEVLAVGDAAFQQKCFDVFNDLRRAGRTILFVTHDMQSVQRFCHRAMLLEHGNVAAIGDPQDIASRYLELNFGRGEPADARAVEAAERPGDHSARIVEAWIEDQQGVRADHVAQGARCRVRVLAEFAQPVRDPAFTLLFRNDRGQDVLVTTTAWNPQPLGAFAPGERATVSVGFDCVLAPGRYDLSAIVAHQGSGTDVIDRWDGIFSFLVVGPTSAGGLVEVPYETSVERGVPEQVP